MEWPQREQCVPTHVHSILTNESTWLSMPSTNPPLRLNNNTATRKTLAFVRACVFVFACKCAHSVVLSLSFSGAVLSRAALFRALWPTPSGVAAEGHVWEDRAEKRVSDWSNCRQVHSPVLDEGTLDSDSSGQE